MKDTRLFFFSRRREPGAFASDELPRGFRVRMNAASGGPCLQPTKPVDNPILKVWCKKEAGEPLTLDEAIVLEKAGVDPGVNVETLRAAVLERAEHLELAGRFEEAAQLYEKAEAWERAGVARIKAKTHYIQSTQINLNNLLDQVRKEGLVLRYSCPSCGSGLKISQETESVSLRSCPYCGSTLDTGLVAKYLRQNLG